MYSNEGIVLRKDNKGEDDKSITLFTKDYGKINVLAKSVRKSSSKLASHLELFSVVNISFVLGKAQKVLTSASELKKFPSVNSNLEKLKAVNHIAGLIFRYVPEEEGDEDIYNTLISALSYVDENDFSQLEMDYLLRYFEFRLLSLLGYMPNEKHVIEFFSNKNKKINRRSVDEIGKLFLRYFNNII